ncbi:MAG: ribosome-associated translation inhibitor RaiA [Acetobacteraceae bacterium]|jgi:ribosome hibernation promoting factor
MQITVSGKQVELSDALQQRVSDELTGITGKYFEHAQEARITFARSRLGFICDINLHAGRGLTLRGEAEGTDAYTAFDKAAVNVGKRLRRYRRRVNEHARDEAQRTRPESARQIILRAEAEDHEEPDTAPHVAPTVIAETTTEIAHLSVSEAVMRMELAEQTVLMFRDANSGVLNVVYRRADGNIGWIDPGD